MFPGLKKTNITVTHIENQRFNWEIKNIPV